MKEEKDETIHDEESDTPEEPEVEVIDSDKDRHDSEEEETLGADEEKTTDADEKETAASDENKMVMLNNELEKVKKEKEEIEDRMLRIQAEYNNFKKRTTKEKEAIHTYKAQDLATDILPVLDNFERALAVETNEETESFLEGMSMIYKQLVETLESHGVEKIEAVGNEFDPNMHHAVMQVEEEDKGSNIIVEELQSGYRLKDRVIRPAMVKVNK